jgi:uncharacterized membrane protein YphA (DoxX/SURF4 family)
VPQQSDRKYIGPRTRSAARAAIAVVWLYQGLWCKLLARCPSHAAIVRALPPPVGSAAALVLTTIGAIEVILAIWVVSGWRSRSAAAAQTMLVIVMNAGGLVWGRSEMADPFGTVVNNVILLTLAWIVADARA